MVEWPSCPHLTHYMLDEVEGLQLAEGALLQTLEHDPILVSVGFALEVEGGPEVLCVNYVRHPSGCIAEAEHNEGVHQYRRFVLESEVAGRLRLDEQVVVA
jgi:hypothetical protein